MDATTLFIAHVFVVNSMLGIGLQVGTEQLREALRCWGFLIRALAVNFIILPLIGVVMTLTIPMSEAGVVAFLVLACAAGGPSALQFTGKQRPAVAYAGELALLLAMLSLFITPVLVELALPAGARLVMPYARTFWLYLLMLAGPLALGMFVRSRSTSVAARFAQPMILLGTVAFVLLIAVTLSTRQAAIQSLTVSGLAAMIGYILIAMLIGWAMGGPTRHTRRVLATASSMRHIALGLLIAEQSFPGLAVEVPLIAFSALMIPPNLIFFGVTMLRDVRRAKSIQRRT